MVKITKGEAQYLRKNGLANQVHMTSATHKSKGKGYYATESPKVKKLLDEYNKSMIITTVYRS